MKAFLKSIEACSDAKEWSLQYSTVKELYDNCTRGDWLIYSLYRLLLHQHVNMWDIACSECNWAANYRNDVNLCKAPEKCCSNIKEALPWEIWEKRIEERLNK